MITPSVYSILTQMNFKSWINRFTSRKEHELIWYQLLHQNGFLLEKPNRDETVDKE